ncbi:MAG: hypothetical protein HY204_06240 [Nitrospirae bacterium]|nr:hypothetical protein [Nitrospirota bacterium]
MIVFDASTLILLAKIDILREVLVKMDAVIPKVIEDETTGQKERPDAQMIRRCIRERLIRIQDGKEVKKTDLAKLMHDFHLAEGEATALLLARKRAAGLATDDAAAIKACKIFGVPFVTAANLLVYATQKEWIPKNTARVKLELLSQVGRYDIRIIEDARERIQGG